MPWVTIWSPGRDGSRSTVANESADWVDWQKAVPAKSDIQASDRRILAPYTARFLDIQPFAAEEAVLQLLIEMTADR